MAEKKKLKLPIGYDAEAEPEDATGRVRRGRGDLVNGLKQLAKVNAQRAILDAKRDALMAELMPMMRKPVSMLDPMTGLPVFAAAAQANPMSVDAGELRAALIEHGFTEDDADVIVGDVLKPPAVDTTENGLFIQACERTGPHKIPMEVVAKVVKVNPSSAYIGFSKSSGKRSST